MVLRPERARQSTSKKNKKERTLRATPTRVKAMPERMLVKATPEQMLAKATLAQTPAKATLAQTPSPAR